MPHCLVLAGRGGGGGAGRVLAVPGGVNDGVARLVQWVC